LWRVPGDRSPNARLVRLRALVPTANSIVGIDLPAAKQMVVVCDHDSKVLARKTFRCRPGTSASRTREVVGQRGNAVRLLVAHSGRVVLVEEGEQRRSQVIPAPSPPVRPTIATKGCASRQTRTRR
jgi:hypothetical protein